jgi:Domain of unknown function (DUF4130
MPLGFSMNKQAGKSGQSAFVASGEISVSDELAYVHDGTLEGLLSVIFSAYEKHSQPTDIASGKLIQMRLGQTVLEIPTNLEHAVRVQRAISRVAGEEVFNAIKRASLSDNPETGMIIFRFVQHALKTPNAHACKSCSRKGRCSGLCSAHQSTNVLNNIAHPAVQPFISLARFVENERHAIMQFLRFEHLEGDLWFARCNPKASIVPLIMDWFSARFNTQPFLIYDEVHHIAGVYEGKQWYLVKTDSLVLPQKNAEEESMQQAWKRFYKTIAVESRYNPELRTQLMPQRFWKNITEMQQERC